MIVETGLAESHYRGIRESSVDACSYLVRPARGFVRVDTSRGGEVELSCELDGVLGRRRRVRDDQNVTHACLARARDDGWPVRVEALVAQVAMGIYQHSTPPPFPILR